VILRSKNCIFVHIPKVAGQSIEAALRAAVPQAAGDSEDLGLRRRNRDEPGPERLAHLTGIEYPELGFVSYEEFRAFFKFAFVRNPWDRTFSMYRHFGFDEHMSFEYFLQNILKREMWKKKYWFVRPQRDFIVDGHGEICVDFVGRFEKLDEDFRHVASALRLNIETLPQVNRAGTKKRFGKLRALKRYPRVLTHWREMLRPPPSVGREQYSAEAIGVIGELYHCDIAQFGYDREPLADDSP
jgi:Sulfotransferase family